MKQLFEKDYDAIMEYTKANSYVNLFIVGDLMNEGFNDEIQSFYGRYNSERKLENILLAYRDASLHLYADSLLEEDFEFLEKIIIDKKIKSMNFGEKTEPQIKAWLATNEWKFNVYDLSVYTPGQKIRIYENTHNIGIVEATIDDASSIIELTHEVFEDSHETVETIRDSFKRKSRLFYVIKENGVVVSMASAVAFSDAAAMIIGVGTRKSARQKGYASLCVQKLSDTLYDGGRKAVLFFDNPSAGSIYHKIGFVDQEKYWMCKYTKNEQQ